MTDLVVRTRRAVTAIGERPAAVCVTDGVITAIADFDAPIVAAQDITVAGVLLPGLVDSHVHINEPGRTQWEGFETATRAAAAGGVTTVIDMPLNSIPPTCDVPALQVKREAALGKTFVDVGFWGGSIPGNVGDLAPLWAQGVFGFKCFLLHSGVDEFPASSLNDLAAALEQISAFDGLMIVHAEDSDAIERAAHAGSRVYRDFLASRPKGAENVAIAELIEEARRTNARVHVLHLSSADALSMIRSAREDGVRITAETCPHYLTLTAEEVADGATQYKCCPPIRESRNQDRLWAGLKEGVISMVVSDHSPCTADLKRFDEGDFQTAWGGISSVQLGLPAIWSQAGKRQFSLYDMVQWMSAQPAALAGLSRKGAIEVGKDADFVVFDPDARFTVDATKLFHRNPVTPYAGKTLTGVVKETWLRGQRIYADGKHSEPMGQQIRRDQ